MSSSERGRVNASFRQQVWSLVPISSGVARVKTPGFVLGGDVVRLMHGNMDHCITTPPPDSQVLDDSGRWESFSETCSPRANLSMIRSTLNNMEFSREIYRETKNFHFFLIELSIDNNGTNMKANRGRKNSLNIHQRIAMKSCWSSN